MTGYRDIRSYERRELSELLVSMGQKPYTAVQLFDWLHRKHVTEYRAMTNLSKALREELSDRYLLCELEIVDKQISKLDGTMKYLFRLYDGQVIESVLMRYSFGNSVCISSQAGCRMGCRFCASAIGGLKRNLEPAEMLGQIYAIAEETGERISHVVVMGTGEPLDNYNALVSFIRILTDGKGYGLSGRNITVSTCGLVPRIRALADEQFALTLAVSLHAPNDEKRRRLMPVAEKYSIAEILDACRYYFKKTGRRLTFEYSLTAGENDGEEDAAELAALLEGMNCHVNLIPVNPVRERGFSQPDKKVIVKFQNNLEKSGINVTIRREMGRDINGACGQLRRSYLGKEERTI